MYLKRLEVQGFKSFVTRTVFEFGPGITAVVGPNGSGKSNISDAIRWVLGEQSARVLRLRRAEDAVYAGGGKRAPAGMAEVSLWLDNTKGWLPLAYDEVVVTRRLHRSGDSEYLINRHRVRLRDVNDLFLRARVGQNSYALMGQGLVDQVLSLRPEERRRLLEEAADVRRHHVRIEEAQGRLATTRENLEKVDLIVAEISPRLGQLERAARRAQEHARLVEELAEAQNAWYSMQWQQRGEALVAARALYDQRSAQSTSALAEVDQLDARLEVVVRRVAERQAEVTRLGEHLRELREQARAADHRHTLETERLGFVHRRLDDLRAEMGDLARERDDLRHTLTDETRADSPGALTDARAAVESLVQELNTAQAVLGHSRRSLAESEQAQRRVSSDLQEIDDALNRLDREDFAAQQTHEQLQERHAAQIARLKQIGRESRELRRVLIDAAREVERAHAARRTALDELERARDAALTASKAVEAQRTAIEEQKRRHAMVERLRDQARGIDRAAQVVLDEALNTERPVRPRVIGLLADLLRVRPGMERAVEAALSDYLTAVVVERDRDAMLALDLLADRAAGRAVLLPLDAARAIPPLALEPERGVRGVASDFIRCDPQLRALVDALLGRVIVVDDVETGRMILQRGLGTVVTIDGTVLRPDGAIVGGRAPAESSLFALDRELESAAAEIERLLAEQEAHRATVDALTARVRELEPWVQAAAERVDRAEREYARAHTPMLALRGHLAPVRGELSYIRATVRQEDARRPMRAAERESLMLRRTRAEQARNDARRAVQQARRTLDASAPHREDLSTRLTEARDALSALEREHAAQAELQRNRRIALERIEERIHARRREADARTSEIAAVEADRLDLAQVLRALTAQIESTETALAVAREHLASIIEERAELEPEQSRKRAQVTELERLALAAENDVHRRAQDLDRLREEMIEEGFVFEREGSSGATSHGMRPFVDSPLGPRRLEPVVTERIVVLDADALREQVRSLRARVRNLGSVNTQAQREFDEAKQRHDFLAAQAADLREAEIGLREAIAALRTTVREQFRATFERVNLDFERYFKAFFGGGSAQLVLSTSEDEGEAGIEIVARPPGKRLQSLTLLSGGERSMTAVALLFALLESNPAPFCVLDEVDAALDEANVNRFGHALKDLATRTQFVVITHNRGTIQSADTIYGVSMNSDGASGVLSLRLADVPE